jgi:hypothetical protein
MDAEIRASPSARGFRALYAFRVPYCLNSLDALSGEPSGRLEVHAILQGSRPSNRRRALRRLPTQELRGRALEARALLGRIVGRVRQRSKWLRWTGWSMLISELK